MKKSLYKNREPRVLSEKEVNTKRIGFIAQDVEKFIPESIKEGTKPFYGKDEKDTTIYKSINYDMIVPHLIESIKELKSEIDDLKSKLENK